MAQTHQLQVDLGARSYPIYLGDDLLTSPQWHTHIGSDQVFIVTDDIVAPLYLETLKNNLNHYHLSEIILPNGEAQKTLSNVSKIFDQLIEHKQRRNTTLIGLGGGVIGDMTGFAAACYQRGVNFLQIPTTLLAQVDASVGGKTAVNHSLGKNLIGAFYQPKAVIIDLNTLTTLPKREFSAGIAEIVKAALIKDELFFDWLEANMTNIMAHDQAALTYAIEQACLIKIKVVILDEKEQTIRVVLNLGHTFAHAIEQVLGYGVLLHGEAVAIGLVLAAQVSVKMGLLERTAIHRIKNILTIAKLPIRLPHSLPIEKLLHAMSMDKKNDSEQLKLILLKGIGQAIISSDIDQNALKKLL